MLLDNLNLTMAYDQYLADRIRVQLKDKSVAFEEKEMMGGLTFMVDNKMCVGIVKNDLMARVGPEANEKALEKDHARPMDFTGRPMKGYIFVSPEGVDADTELSFWIDLCLEYNPKAKASKKR